MTDEEFNGLATRYLEDELDEGGRNQLNIELSGSEDRVRQFNDLRMLAGLILEHGRSAMDVSETAPFHENRTQRKSREWKRWAAAAAILMLGFIVCMLLSQNKPNVNGEETVSAPVSTILMDIDFEDATAGSLEGIPKAPGRWGGDSIELVSSANSDVPPKTGKSMACLTLPESSTSSPAEPESKRAIQWRIVTLPEGVRDGATVAELFVEFNRDAEVPNPELACRIELYSFKGRPETAETQLKSQDYLAAAISHFKTDSDPKTWQTAVSKLQLSPDADFMLLGISGFAVRIPQPFGGERFSGHYADGVQLILTNSNNNQTQ